MSASGQKRRFDRADHFRSTPESRHVQSPSACLKGARTWSVVRPAAGFAPSSDVRVRETQCETRSNTPGKYQ
jgi:hypothetical protein